MTDQKAREAAKEHAESVTQYQCPSELSLAWPSHEQFQAMKAIDPVIRDFLAGVKWAIKENAPKLEQEGLALKAALNHENVMKCNQCYAMDRLSEHLDQEAKREQGVAVGGEYAVGVGDGSGNLWVYGNYESAKAAQAIIFERDAIRAELAKERRAREAGEKAIYHYWFTHGSEWAGDVFVEMKKILEEK
jgi:hypothetical protein